MNNKQKLGYILLGAGIMLVGITIGQLVSPNIEAHNNGVFDEIVCSRLSVVNKEGKQVILLGLGEYTSVISGKRISQNGMWIYDNEGNKIIALETEDAGSGIQLYDKDGYYAVKLESGPIANTVWINHKDWKRQIGLIVDKGSEMLPPQIWIKDKGKVVWGAP